MPLLKVKEGGNNPYVEWKEHTEMNPLEEAQEESVENKKVEAHRMPILVALNKEADSEENLKRMLIDSLKDKNVENIYKIWSPVQGSQGVQRCTRNST